MKKIFLIMTIALVGMTSCNKRLDEINTNPDLATAVPETNILWAAIASGLNRIHGDNFNITYAGLWSQHYAKIQYIDEDKYAYRPAAMDNHWTGLYAGPLFDLQNIIDIAGADKPNMTAAAMVLKAYYLSVITDVWGNVPYSEALLGKENLTPNYDNQADIYAGLIEMLQTAAGMFDTGADDLGDGDQIYHGDVMKWEMLANSLRVRLLCRTSDRDGGALARAGSILSSEAVFISNDDNAGLVFEGGNNWPNPLYRNKYLDGRNDHAISKSMTDMMNAGGFSSVMDPRLPVYAEANASGDYVGQPNGSVEPSDFAAVSQIGAAFRDDAMAPVYIMTYAELLFFDAEINQNKQAYLDAIAASHEHHGVAADAAYLADADAAWDANWKEALGNQKWIALYGNGAEAFSEFRRLDYPSTLVEAPQSVHPGMGIPTRFPYASTEMLTNGANLDAATAAQGIDATGLFAKVWWDMY